MNTVIFSDVHLNVAEDGRERMAECVRFLRSIDPTETDHIIILGDLFDFWFEYRHVIFSGYFDVLRAFGDLADAGVRFDFVCGNHDFWAGRFLRDHLGFHIHENRLMLKLGGKRVLFVHGDGINPNDLSYRIYKRIARFPLVVRLFRLIHPDWAMAIAQGVSRGSRHLKAVEDPSQGPEVKPLREFARGVLERGEADVVMCGHSHYPVVEEHPALDGVGLYINTGDWLAHQSYVEWDGAAFHLRSFENETSGKPVPAEGA
jgi:UDP-2,3-diacylglucosamine hydrolase